MADSDSESSEGGEEDDYIPNVFNHNLYSQWSTIDQESEDYENYVPFGWAPDPNDANILLPLRGPPDVEQIWSTNMGNDYLNELPDDNPLHDNQLELLQSNTLSEIIRNIEFVRKLGRGSVGKVYEIRADYLQREPNSSAPLELEPYKRLRFACKISLGTGSLQDMRILRYLRHENICNLAEVIHIPDFETQYPYAVICLISELCDGSLHSLVDQYRTDRSPDKQHLPETLSRHWFAQIVKGLDYIHSRSVVHGDISDENILFSLGTYSVDTFEDRFLSSTFKLSDFGIANMLDPTLSRANQWMFKMGCNADITALFNILLSTAIPVEESHLSRFSRRCRINEWKASDPPEWSTVSFELRNLIGKFDDHEKTPLTAHLILQHSFIQSNAEPRTEPFITRWPQFRVQDSYREWVTKKALLEPDPQFAPFGVHTNVGKQFVDNDQIWVEKTSEPLPIYGVPNQDEIFGVIED